MFIMMVLSSFDANPITNCNKLMMHACRRSSVCTAVLASSSLRLSPGLRPHRRVAAAAERNRRAGSRPLVQLAHCCCRRRVHLPPLTTIPLLCIKHHAAQVLCCLCWPTPVFQRPLSVVSLSTQSRQGVLHTPSVFCRRARA
jgi:hypothetical protein